MKKYQVIYADPPWRYSSSQVLKKKSLIDGKSDFHYPSMTLKDIANMDIDSIRDKNCILFLWVPCVLIQEGISILHSWSFRYGTIAFIWDKQKANMGYYTMTQCELCLVGKYGKIPHDRGARNVRQLISEKKTRHSKKPNEVRKRIELMFPKQNKIELFARERYDGWDAFGNEVQSNINLRK